MISEQEFKRKIRSCIACEYQGEYQTIETTTASGVPDIIVQIPGHPTFWVETKITPNEYGPLLRPEQRVWPYRWAKKGGIAFIVDHYSPELEMQSTYRGWLSSADNPLEVWPDLVNGKYLRIKEYQHFESHTIEGLVKKMLELCDLQVANFSI